MNLPPKRRRLFPDDNDQLTTKDIKAFEQEMRARASIYTESPQKPNFPELIFPHRYESLEAIAKETGIQLRPIIRPVLEALEIIKQEMDFVRQTAKGRLFVISGLTGSGKTTFLHSLHLFSDEQFKIYDLKDIDLSSRQDIEAGLKKLNRDRQHISVVFLEGYEISGALNETQIDTLLTTLNTDFRSDIGRKTLFVIPTTAAVLAQNIGKKAMETGGMTSRDRQFYIFEGPPKSRYVEITSETIRTFNDSRTLLDYGIDDDLARDIAETSESIGQFMENCHNAIMSKRQKITNKFGNVRHKRVHLWMVFCTEQGDMRRSYDVIRSLTIGDYHAPQNSRLLSGESKEVREWHNNIANFNLATAALDVRIMYLPVRTAISIVTSYAPADILKKFKDQDLIKRESVKARAVESLENTSIGQFLKGKKFKDDPSKRGTLNDRQKDLFREIMIIAANSEIILNALIVQTIRDMLDDPTVQVMTEFSATGNKNVKADIAVVTETDIYCLEMKWRSGELQDFEIIRESVSRVTDYVKNLQELSHLFKNLNE